MSRSGSESLLPTCTSAAQNCVCVPTSNSNSVVGKCDESECVLDDSLCVLELDQDQALNIVSIELPEPTYPPIKGRIKDRAKLCCRQPRSF